MAVRTSALALLALAAASTPAWADATLRVEHAAARMVVIPENRADVAYTIQPGRAGLPPIQKRLDGGVTVLDGGLDGGFWPFGIHRGLNCRGSGDHVRVSIPGHGEVALQDLPVITAHVPMNADLKVGDAVFGEIGPSASVSFANAGCGDWRVADVHGPAHFAVSGSGDIRAHDAADARVAISGSGDVYGGASPNSARCGRSMRASPARATSAPIRWRGRFRPRSPARATWWSKAATPPASPPPSPAPATCASRAKPAR